ncbi:tryptophan halogenase family protein [Parvularcula dongshanensis]|uniref:Tryptophan halogenase n=1 Tax=Parvularcula dongshanensis TaxID=1173995 RepID=A0A840I5U2_9PROT|nr:tryptophan halogenase family protein [Parvularcula dongshanensis]MBB4659685.1 tryptophan halogenase [Parvularcula dongshanensis]
MQKNAIKEIVIVGGGTAGWMTAAALGKILGTDLYTITLVESEQIGTVGVGEATIPMIMLYNSVLGINEDEFVRETNATFKLGIEFADWRRLGHSYFHPFGKLGVDMDGIGFVHYWLRWAKQGGSLGYASFNAETQAAREQKFMRTPEGAGALPNINYAFQFDAARYAAYLRRFAEKRGVRRIEGKVVRAEQDDAGDIGSIVMEDGRRVSGDLFVDCSGFRGLLIEEVFATGYDDWSHWLPVNRAVAVPCEKNAPPLPYTRATAREAGWQWRIPLQHRTGNGYVFCTEFTSEDEATEKLMSRLDGAPLADPRILRFVTGVRRKTWVRNCVAIGLSSGFLEPLESTSIHLIQVAIAKLLAMFPRDRIDRSMVARYNDEMRFEYDNVRDFLIAHYYVTERNDTPFWRYVSSMAIPDALQEKLELFSQRGEVMAKHNDLFKETSWFAVLAGQGLMPESYHPVADVISDDELRLRLSRIRTGITERVAQMPKHEAFIEQHCAAAALT